MHLHCTLAQLSVHSVTFSVPGEGGAPGATCVPNSVFRAAGDVVLQALAAAYEILRVTDIPSSAVSRGLHAATVIIMWPLAHD